MTTSASTPTLISSVPELGAFLSSIPPSSTLCLDLEGYSLSRHGTISIITILIHPQNVVRLIDILVLGESAFTTVSNNGKTLKSIFEDPNIPKYIWDVRNDADALWALYGVGLGGVTDIQLLENASRTGDKTYIRGLDKCVQYDLKMKLDFRKINRWIQIKREVQNLMSADVFASRPMDAKTVQYCANDVIHLPDLHDLYWNRMGPDWRAKAMEESARRVAEAHSPGYKPQSPTKTLGPWGSGTERRHVTLNQWREDDFFGDDDEVGYYDDNDDYDDYDPDDWR